MMLQANKAMDQQNKIFKANVDQIYKTAPFNQTQDLLVTIELQSVFEQAVTDVDEGSVDLALERSSTILCRDKNAETDNHFSEKGSAS